MAKGTHDIHIHVHHEREDRKRPERDHPPRTGTDREDRAVKEPKKRERTKK